MMQFTESDANESKKKLINLQTSNRLTIEKYWSEMSNHIKTAHKFNNKPVLFCCVSVMLRFLFLFVKFTTKANSTLIIKTIGMYGLYQAHILNRFYLTLLK